MKLTTPLTKEQLQDLKAGDRVTISGVIYTARDAAHKRIVEALDPVFFCVKRKIMRFLRRTMCR